MRLLRRMLVMSCVGVLVVAGCGEESSDESAGTTEIEAVVDEADADQVEVEPVTIMAIGDSLTELAGWSTYRCYLDQMLNEANVSFDFVGSYGHTANIYDCPSEFDMDHEAVPGQSIDMRAAGALDSVASLQPDVALVLLGSGDIDRGQPFEEVADELAAFVYDVQAANSEITVLVSQLPPCRSAFQKACDEYVPGFNDAIAAFGDLSTDLSTVAVVDMHTGFNVDDLPDGEHPNAAGAEEMARRWMAALVESGAIDASNTHPPE